MQGSKGILIERDYEREKYTEVRTVHIVSLEKLIIIAKV